MKKIFTLIALVAIVTGMTSMSAMAFTKDISKEGFTIQISEFFPSFGTTDKIENSSEEGIKNIPTLIENLIPMITTMMAVGATLMVIWGGYQMIFGGASPAQTEAGKGIIKDALIGLIIGLSAYVLILWTAGGTKLTGIGKGETGLPGENAPDFITVLKGVIGTLQDVVAIIAVLGICLVGIMYIMSRGDEEKTESAKKYMVGILVGVILAFVAWGMISLINLIPNSFNI